MRSRSPVWFQALLLIGMIVLGAGCVTPTAPTATPQPPHDTTTPMPTVQPTDHAAVAPTTPPSTMPMPMPMTQTADAPPSLVGPAWNVAYDGDLNRDGQHDVVAYLPASIAPDVSTLTEQDRAEYPLTISEVIIVQADEQDAPFIQAHVSSQGISASGTPLLAAAQFGTPGPSAFLMGVDAGAEVPVRVIPLDTQGKAYAQGVGLFWHEGQRAYRLFAGGQPVPPPDVPPGSTLPLDGPTATTPQEIDIVLYWVKGEEVVADYRRIPHTLAVGTAAIELLLAGPPPGLSTALPTPDEVQHYPGRHASWGDRVRLVGLTIDNGLATVNFSQEMNAYGGGSARVQLIREQIRRTLLQFPTVDDVQIAIDGETDGVLQP